MASEAGTSSQALLATIWLFTAIALILFVFRIVARRTVQQKLYWDDAFAALAMALLLAESILYTLLIPYTYETIAIMTGQRPKLSPAEQHQFSVNSRKLGIPIQTFFWTGLWAVKFSFLFLYKLVICHKRVICIIWYICSAFMLLSWGVMLSAVFAQCGPHADLFNFPECSNATNVMFERDMLWVEFVLVIITDLIVIILPLPVLWTLHMSTRQKLAITPVFCLAIICIAFDTLRTVEQYKGSLTLGLLWTSLELEIAVIVCMLPSFRFLFSDSDVGRLNRNRFLHIVTLGTVGSSRSDIALVNRQANGVEPDSHRWESSKGTGDGRVTHSSQSAASGSQSADK